MATFKHVDAPTIAGTWPILSAPQVGGTPLVLANTLVRQATVMGMRRETPSGYDVGGKSFRLTIDGSLSTISFPAGGPYDLDTVIAEINTDAGATVALRDNGFLRITSTTVGGNSSVLVETDPASSPEDVLDILGLFPGVTSAAGELVSTPSVDPTRQITAPGQLTLAEGENISSEAFNRALLQLSINSDTSYGVTHRKRVGKVKSVVEATPSNGFTLTDTIYTGANASPTTAQLKDVIAILDDNGDEPYIEKQVNLGTGPGTFTTDADQTDRTVFNSTVIPLGGTQDTDNRYLVSSDGAMGALAGVPLKIMELIDGDNVVVQAVDPTDGSKVDLDTGSITVSLVSVTPTQILVTAIEDGSSNPVEQQQVVKQATTTISRIENNNRIVCAGATFQTSNVVEGDLVNITSHTSTNPYTNNGTYRVLRVADERTLDLQTEDYGPVFLNPDGILGDAEVTTDGDFWTNPFIVLNETYPNQVTVIYRGMSTLNDVTDDAAGLGGSLLSLTQETDIDVTSVILKMLGPSATDFSSYLYNDERVSLESLNFQMTNEHTLQGRHDVIRPTKILFFDPPNGDTSSEGETLTFRIAAGDAGNAIKMAMRRWDVNTTGPSDNNAIMYLRADGIFVLQENNNEAQILLRADGTARFSDAGYTDGGIAFDGPLASIQGDDFTAPSGWIINGDGSINLNYLGDTIDIAPGTAAPLYILDNTNSIVTLTLEATANAAVGQFFLQSTGTDGRSNLIIKGASNESPLLDGDGFSGATNIRMVANSEAGTAQQDFRFVTHPAASPKGIFKLVVEEDGTGGDKDHCFVLDVEGYVSFNTRDLSLGDNSQEGRVSIYQEAGEQGIAIRSDVSNPSIVLFNETGSLDERMVRFALSTTGFAMVRLREDFTTSTFFRADAATGFVGINTTLTDAPLHVVAEASGSNNQGIILQSKEDDQRFYFTFRYDDSGGATPLGNELGAVQWQATDAVASFADAVSLEASTSTTWGPTEHSSRLDLFTRKGTGPLLRQTLWDAGRTIIYTFPTDTATETAVDIDNAEFRLIQTGPLEAFSFARATGATNLKPGGNLALVVNTTEVAGYLDDGTTESWSFRRSDGQFDFKPLGASNVSLRVRPTDGISIDETTDIFFKNTGTVEGVGWYGTGKLFDSVALNGPVLFGVAGVGFGVNGDLVGQYDASGLTVNGTIDGLDTLTVTSASTARLSLFASGATGEAEMSLGATGDRGLVKFDRDTNEFLFQIDGTGSPVTIFKVDKTTTSTLSPGTTNQHDLGSASLRWQAAHIQEAQFENKTSNPSTLAAGKVWVRNGRLRSSTNAAATSVTRYLGADRTTRISWSPTATGELLNLTTVEAGDILELGTIRIRIMGHLTTNPGGSFRTELFFDSDPVINAPTIVTPSLNKFVYDVGIVRGSGATTNNWYSLGHVMLANSGGTVTTNKIFESGNLATFSNALAIEFETTYTGGNPVIELDYISIDVS